jgi:hypothetical protein
MLLKLDSAEAARRLADSLLASRSADPAAAALASLYQTILFGRPSLFSRLLPGGSPFGRYAVALAQLGAGVVPDSLDDIEAAFLSFASGPGAGALGVSLSPDILVASSFLAFPMRRPRAGLDTTRGDPRIDLLAAASSEDTSRARRAVAALDQLLAAAPRDAPDDGGLFLSAQVHLMLGDSTAALEQLLEFERRWVFLPLRTSLSPSGFSPVILVWGRASLLLADLAAARGRRDVAARCYRRVAALWDGAEPEIRPFAARAREALARLGAQ